LAFGSILVKFQRTDEQPDQYSQAASSLSSDFAPWGSMPV
jgi:hypothetical protein